MVQIKYNGFVSNIYFCVNLLLAIVFGLFFTSLIWLFDNAQVHAVHYLILFCFAVILVIFVEYFRSPAIFKRVVINSEGIRCGKLFVKYENIEKITVTRGCVYEWFGLSWFQDMTGIPQHAEVTVEDIICINCDFQGFKSKKAKGCIYIPRNQQTDEILRRYSEDYADLSDALLSEGESNFKIRDKYETIRVIGISLLLLFVSVLLIFSAILGYTSAYKIAIVLPLGIILILLSGFKNHATSFLKKRINEKLKLTKG